jgi:hypothetical protein
MYRSEKAALEKELGQVKSDFSAKQQEWDASTKNAIDASSNMKHNECTTFRDWNEPHRRSLT